MTMTAKQRLVTALERGVADRLPVTTHHLMPYFLDKYMGGMSNQACFEHFGLDPITWTVPHRPDTAAGEYFDPLSGRDRFPGKPAHRVRLLARRVGGCAGPGLRNDTLPLRDPQGHAHDGAPVQ